MIVMTAMKRTIRAAAPTILSKHCLCAKVKVMMFVSQQQQRPALQVLLPNCQQRM
jgi:hypothetical protein